MGEGETTEPALSLSIPELKKALLSKLYTNIYIKGACPKTRNGNSDKCPRYDPRLINSYMCSFDPITEENIKKDWDMNEEKRYLSSIIPFPKVTKKNDELTYEWIHMCLRPSNRYFEKSDTMISLIDFLNEYTQTPGEPEEGYPLTNAQDLTRYLKTDVPKINKTDVKNLNEDGTTTTYTNNYNCYAQPAPIMVCALYTICNSDNFGKMGEKYDDTNGMVQRELIDYDEKNKSKLFERWKLIYESLYSGSCSGDPAANVCLASSSENTEKIATNDDNKCKETAGENVKYLIGDGSSETPYYTNSGFMGKWNGTTDKDGVIIESFITSITDSG